jgi:hypothetical protein
MCEPPALARTGLTVRQHQTLTTANYLALRDLAPAAPWLPILQGWEPDQYAVHAAQYQRAGVDLAGLPTVGLGSVCRRQDARTLGPILDALPGLRLHGFGLKTTALREFSERLASTDSMAWSYDARRGARHPDCAHRTCANCFRYALHWRQRLPLPITGACPHPAKYPPPTSNSPSSKSRELPSARSPASTASPKPP